jgi:hypothetical protein
MARLQLGDNSLDKAQLRKIFKDIDQADAELDTLKSAYMTRCKRPRKKIRDARKHAKGLGIDMAAFSVAIKDRRARWRIDARRHGLEPGEQQALDAIMAALGDYASTDLGKAAVRRAGNLADDLAGGLDDLNA